MGYRFDKASFEDLFNVKSTDEKAADSIRLTHTHCQRIKLFPYKASGKNQAPIVIDMDEVVCSFFKEVSGKKRETIKFDELINRLKQSISIDDSDIEQFEDMIRDVYFDKDIFVANSASLYQYQSNTINKSVENIAKFLCSVFGIEADDEERIHNALDGCVTNVLERMLITSLEKDGVSKDDDKVEYYIIIRDIGRKFKEDLFFMLEEGMTSIEELACLFALYYFNYVSQCCITLDNYCSGTREQDHQLYFAVDWERVSKNRMCCIQGWNKLSESINHMFSHAITLEILNNSVDGIARDYISFGKMALENSEIDESISNEIKEAEKTYCEYIGDYKKFDEIPEFAGGTRTESSIRHLEKCIEDQFLGTERKRANEFYNEKFEEFCKGRWIKNRKKSGLVLNLTERDLILITKICIGKRDKVRLNSLFEEYEKRGIFLDATSREYVQDFFTKLNLIDKKSDSGDAQYVKRIL